MKKQIKSPFLVVNPKAYLYGDTLLELAKYADQLSEDYQVDILFTAQHVDIKRLSEETKHLTVIAQHMDGIVPGTGMGYILPEGIKEAGAKGTFLNHAEHPMTIHQLAKAMERANALQLLTIVCADSLKEASVLAQFEPDIMVCEPTELIGTGKVSDSDYMEQTNKVIKAVSPNTYVLQAAGISTGQDVLHAISSGADGTGGTSGIVCSEAPKAVLKEMVEALVESQRRKERLIK